MANNIVARILGGKLQEFSNMETVGDVRKELGLSAGYAATVNGETADDQYELNDHEQVCFAPAVKGGI